MNTTTSLVVGGYITIYNAGTNAFAVQANDASTVVVTTLLAGQSVQLILSANGTANGTFLVIGPFGGAATGPGNFTTLTASGNTSVGGTFASTGAATFSSTLNNVTITPPGSTATLTLGSGKALTINNSLTFAGSDNTTFTFPSSSDTVVTLTAAQTLTNKTLTTAALGSSTATTQVAGTSNTTVATTAFANPASSLGSSGYQTFPSGLILEWGSVSYTGSPVAVTFPIPFPTSLFQITMSANTSAAIAVSWSSSTNSGFIANAGTNAIIGWMAVGN